MATVRILLALNLKEHVMTTEIPVAEWSEFLQSFSQQHDNAIVGVEVMSPEVGAQVEGRELRFRGLSTDPTDQPSTLFVSLENDQGDHLTCVVATPTHIWLEQTPAGADLALQIDAADRSSTLLRFRPVARPESFDGVIIDRHR
jgi:hypothetical protein